MDVLFVDQSTGLNTVRDLETRPRGGMINSLFKVSDYLASQGHNVKILSDIKQPSFTSSGVAWVNANGFSDTGFDVLVCNRGIGDGYPDIKAKKRIVWIHDLPHSGFAPNPKIFKAFDTVFMSQYARRVWTTFYKDIERCYYIPNGVDKNLFYPRDKDHKHIIYFSHPNRGLNKLPLIADAIASRYGPVKFRAYCNPDKMYPNDKDPRDHVTESTLDYKSSESLEILDPIPSHELAEEVGKAGLMIMPSGYPEICSNNVLQSLASGTPIITTGNLGATREWVRHRKNGMLTKYLPNDYMVHTIEMVRNAVEVLEDRRLHNRLIKNAAKTKVYSWTEIGRKWEKLLSS